MEGDLLGLGEVVRRVARQRQQADRLHRRELLGHELGRVEQVDALRTSARGCPRRPGRRAPTAGNAPASIASARSRRWKSGSIPASICASSQVRECTPSTGFQWNLTSEVSPSAFDEPEGVHAEALHRPVRARDAAVGHVPDRVVLGLGVQRDEVPERVVGALRLRDLAVRVRLAGVDDVGELDPVLDEEHRDVVADQVEGALVRCRTSSRTRGCRGPCRPNRASRAPSRTDEHRRSRRPRPRKPARQMLAGVAVAHEDAVRAGAARVHHPLGDALVVEVGDLLAQVVVLQQRRSALPRLERVVGVAQPQRPGTVVRNAPCWATSAGAASVVGAGRRTAVGAGLVGLRRQRALRLGGFGEGGRLRRRGTRHERGVLSTGQ